MSVASDDQRKVLAGLDGSERLSSVALAMQSHLGLVRTTAAATMLVLRGCAARHADGTFSITNEGRDVLAGKRFRPGPVLPDRKMKAARDSLRQRAWSAMRIQQRFTIPDLVRVDETNAAATLQRYVYDLARAGYVVELPARAAGHCPTSNGFKVFRLIRDTGSDAPTKLRSWEVVDRNTAVAT